MPLPSSKPEFRPSPMPLDNVVQQHAEETAVLRDNRSVLVRAAHISLPLLQRHDARIAAHLDGLGVAGPAGAMQCQLALQDPGAGAMFAATVCAIEAQDYRAVEPLLELVTARGPNSAALRRGLLSAFGWVSPHLLRGMGHRLLAADAPRLRHLGLDVCRLHGVDPGAALGKALVDADVAVRVTALLTLGELGMVHHQTQVHVALDDPEPSVVVAAAMASCLLDGLDRGDDNAEARHCPDRDGCSQAPDLVHLTSVPVKLNWLVPMLVSTRIWEMMSNGPPTSPRLVNPVAGVMRSTSGTSKDS